MPDWPIHATIDGPIVMIGFGSIGRGTLPLILRHFKFDKSRMVVVDPDDSDRKLLDEHGIRFVHQAVTRERYRHLLRAASDGGRRAGLLREPLRRHLLARHHAALPRDRRALHRYRRRAVAGLLFRPLGGAGGAHQQCAAQHRARGEGEESRRHDRRLLLRRQSRHGVVVRQAGAGQSRGRSRATLSTSPVWTTARAGRG